MANHTVVHHVLWNILLFDAHTINTTALWILFKGYPSLPHFISTYFDEPEQLYKDPYATIHNITFKLLHNMVIESLVLFLCFIRFIHFVCEINITNLTFRAFPKKNINGGLKQSIWNDVP